MFPKSIHPLQNSYEQDNYIMNRKIISRWMYLFLLGISVFLIGSCKQAVRSEKEIAQCYWMENYSGQFKWVAANAIHQKVLSQSECYALDSCSGGKGESDGGCYKWSVDADGNGIPW